MRAVKISPLLESIVLEIVNYLLPKKVSLRGRPSKCSNKEHLDAMFYVLKEGIGWNYLNGYKIKGDSIRKVYNKWVKLGVFHLSYKMLLDIYSEFKLDFNDLYIDSSHIKNYMGCETVGCNHYDRFRKATKVSIIVDDIGIPIGITLDKSSVHDIKLTVPTLEEISIPIDTTQYIIADKGYVSTELKNKLANKYKLELIVPRKKKKNTIGKIRGRKPKNEYKLNNRFVVERTFSWFKHYTRLFRRKDKKRINFESFIFFGASNIISSKITNIIIMCN